MKPKIGYFDIPSFFKWSAYGDLDNDGDPD
jgi:hypothetical protein